MNIIPQMKLFEESEYENLGDLERLKTVLDTLNDGKLIQKAVQDTRKGSVLIYLWVWVNADKPH